VVAGSALVVAKLLDDVMGADDVAQRDPRITEWLVEHRTDAWTSFFRAVTHLGDPLVVAAVAATVALGLFALRRRRLAVMVLVSTAGTAVITTVAKLAVDRGRPPPALWLTTASGPAFPSGHAAQSVALWGALVVVVWASVRSPAVRLAAAALAGMAFLGVGVSRVYLGVHWASDVLCGWAVATMWVTVLVLLGWSLPRLAGLGLAGRARRPT
jgi:undecaprenyl-diphosphatase